MSAPVLLGVAALLLVLLTSCAWQMLAALPPYVDDAYIYLRYARNVAEGEGPVWNPGEQPTEGFTSSAYLALLSVSECAGWHDPARAGWFGVAFGLVTVLLAVGLSGMLCERRWGMWLLVPASVSLCPQFEYWSTAGLETTLFSASVLAAAIGYVAFLSGRTPPVIVAALLALVTLVRPEGLVVATITIGFEAARVISGRSSRSGLMQIAGIVLAVQAALVAARMSIFGELLPNTYYAKTGGGLRQVGNGLLYLARSCRQVVIGSDSAVSSPLASILSAIALLAVVLVLAAAWAAVTGGRRLSLGYVLAVCAGLVAAAAAEGGDHFGNARFVVPALPVAMAAFGASLALRPSGGRASRAVNTVGGLVAVALAVAWAAAISPLTVSGRVRADTALRTSLPVVDSARMMAYPASVPVFILMGQTLRRFAGPDESIAVVPIGAIGYYSRLKVVDMVGIVDQVIAHTPLDDRYSASWRPGHDKGDGAYVLSRRPDLIQLVDGLTSQPHPGPDDNAMQYKSIVEIWGSEEFHTRYRFEPIAVGGGWYYNLYRRVQDEARSH